jgi:hypothetical protein
MWLYIFTCDCIDNKLLFLFITCMIVTFLNGTIQNKFKLISYMQLQYVYLQP